MVNPYSCYILGFAFALAVYQLGWSEVYPPLSLSLIAFIIVTLTAHFFLSRSWNSRERAKKVRTVHNPIHNPYWVTGFIYLLWTLDFIHEGGIPLFKMIAGLSFDYRSFGFPVVHVFTVTFSSFYCLYLLWIFLETKSKKYIWLYVINLISSLLIYNRGILFINLSSSFFLYLLLKENFSIWKGLLGIPFLILSLYLFGVIGNTRVSFEANSKYNPSLFLDNGRATPEFRNSIWPKEFFWAYIYISSPLANLQVNINTTNAQPVNLKRVLLFVNNEWLFESISKRVNTLAGAERVKVNIIKDPFNVSTVYSHSFSYLGWVGILLTGIFILFLPIAYRRLINQSPYQTISFAIMCTIYLFLAFDNTIRLMALGFQLVYPFVFPFAEKWLLRLKVKR